MNFSLSPRPEKSFSVGGPSDEIVLAVGADLKNTICLLREGTAYVSPCHEALSEPRNFRAFLCDAEAWRSSAGGEVTLAHDLHPAYSTTIWVQGQAHRRVAVQHHHAHLASVLAEHDSEEEVVGIVCDGTGWGSDGAIWGGEVLVGSRAGYERWAHIEYYALPGGDAAARQTWRPALSLVEQAYGGNVPAEVASLFDRVEPRPFKTVRRMIQAGINVPLTSSLGRLFDAVAFLVGCCDANDLEGLAPARLEELAGSRAAAPYDFHVRQDQGRRVMVVREWMRELCRDLVGGVEAATVAARFHATVAAMFAETATAASQGRKLGTVVLSGGCMLNRTLVAGLQMFLQRGAIQRVLTNRTISPGDAGLSVGQAVVAAARSVRRTGDTEPRRFQAPGGPENQKPSCLGGGTQGSRPGN